MLAVGISFAGWLWETLLMLCLTGEYYDRGFITLPFCPIYGTAVIGTYFLLGAPDKGRGMLKEIKNKAVRYALYAAFCFIIPTLAELFVGLIFDKSLHLRLWEYSAYPCHFGGYICLPISLSWAVLLFLFMKVAFLPLKRLFYKIPELPARVLATVLSIALSTDFLINIVLAIK